MVALGDDKAQDKARSKGTKHDVEIEDRRKGHEHDKDEDRKAHERLRRGIGTVLDKAEEAVPNLRGRAGTAASTTQTTRNTARIMSV